MQGFACILFLSLLFCIISCNLPQLPRVGVQGWRQRGKDSLGKKDAHRGYWAPTQTSSLLSSVMAFCP